ncbi:sodium-coupled neutral amino acid transporter 1-like isoform X1 [Chiloscyllium plagiosum]|uniref:sodium-coupled neutral amino acid transporter 1-like isoform X1 n=2 Tax=Chiloscyllium plagiosum TaxID=36176 RepID=UPI001CB8421A|nr:sodium-coupled neutral amino acid transporter 1-like isoform X1 [Chiloscyllium plagiosum]
MDNLESKGGNNSGSSELKDFTHSQDGLQRKCDNDDLECTMYHANSDDGRKENKENYAGSTSMYMSVFNLSNAIIGTGLLGLSYAMANTGIIPFVFLLIVIATLSLYSIHLLLQISVLTGSMVYETLGQHAFGRPGKLAVFGSTSLQNIGAILSYLFVVKKELPEVIQSFTGQDSSEAWYLIDRNLVILVTLIIILPLCLFRNIGYLGYTSGFSLACMIFFLIVVIYKQTQLSCDTSVSTNITDLVCTITCTPEYFVWNDKTVYALPTMAFAFVCHPSVLPIYRELKDHTCKKMQVVSTISFFSMFAIYLLTAIFGYLTFYNTVNEELLLSYRDHGDKLILILRLAVITAVVLTVPVLLFTVRSSIVLLVLKGKFRWLHHFIITFFLLTGSSLLVIYIPSIMDVFAVIGSTSANMLIFILPASLYLKLVKNEPQNSWQRKGAMAFLAVGIIFMFVTVPLIFVEWNKRSSNNTSTGSCSGQH